MKSAALSIPVLALQAHSPFTLQRNHSSSFHPNSSQIMQASFKDSAKPSESSHNIYSDVEELDSSVGGRMV